MKEQFDKLREYARNSITPGTDIETALAALDIVEQVVADLHRIADAVEIMNLQRGAGGGAGFLGGGFVPGSVHVEVGK